MLTNKLPTGLNRGYGGQQYIFSLERLVDRVAHDLNLDRLEVRRRNFLKRDEFPYKTTTGSCYDSGDYDGCLDKALAVVKQEDWLGEKEQLRKAGRLVGVGYATAVHSAASNIGYVTLALPPDDRRRANYNPKSGSNDYAHIALDPSGHIRVQIGTAGAGQGHATTAAQVTARELGVRIEDVDVIDSVDTDVTPWTITTGTYASRFSVVVTAAVQRAAVKLNRNSACDRCASAGYRAGHARVRRRRHQEKRVQPVDVAAPACRCDAMESRRLTRWLRRSAAC